MTDLRRSMRLVYTQRGLSTVGRHIATTYGVDVEQVTPLDMGVYKLDRKNGAPWIARVFIPDRSRARVDGDAELLQFLAARDFPAERCAAADPVTMLDDQPVLVTEFIEGKEPSVSGKILTAIGDLLGRLHAMPQDGLAERPGGSLHHVPGFEGLPGKDLDLAAALLDDIRAWVPQRNKAHFERLREHIAETDRCEALPHSLVHPDPALKNMITGRDSAIALIDWGGAGRGPRIVSLAQFLGVAHTTKGWDAARLSRIASAYRAHVQLESREVDRIGAAMRIRALWFAAWTWYTKTAAGRPPNGDEWWVRRATDTDPTVHDAMHAAFG